MYSVELSKLVSDFKNKVAEMIKTIDVLIEAGYIGYEDSKDDESMATFYASEVGKLILNKSVLESVMVCLDPNNDFFSCFAALGPLLEKYYPNKKDWIVLFGFLLAKANRKYNKVVDENEIGELDSTKDSFLNNIVGDNGEFLPYLFTNDDREKLQVLGMEKEQISLIGKHCRSLFKKKRLEESQMTDVAIVKQLVVLEDKNFKEQKKLLNYLKNYISLDTYDVIYSEFITMDTEESIIDVLYKLGFSKESVVMIRHKIKKFNEKIENSLLNQKIEGAKKELFSDEMYGKYKSAVETLTDSSMVYTYIRENLGKLIEQIDSIIINYVNGGESKEDTIEYLIMAFEDLNYTLSLCGPVIKRTL